jgi:hypothetical protein
VGFDGAGPDRSEESTWRGAITIIVIVLVVVVVILAAFAFAVNNPGAPSA